MTNQEKQLINSWADEQLNAFEEARKSYDYIHTKYEELISSKIPSPCILILQIVRTERVGNKQRIADLNAVFKYLTACGQSKALYSFLDLRIG